MSLGIVSMKNDEINMTDGLRYNGCNPVSGNLIRSGNTSKVVTKGKFTLKTQAAGPHGCQEVKGVASHYI